MALSSAKNSFMVLALATTFAFTTQLYASSGVHWGYTGNTGAEHWGTLSPDFAVCGTGKNQSPINLQGFTEAELEPLTLNYATETKEILNNGHTIQINYSPGSTFTSDGKEFMLKQIHFHAPSENQIEGKSFPMEGHLVHASQDGDLAVISVMYTSGKENKAMAAAWAGMPMTVHETQEVSDVGHAEMFLPSNHDYYRFNGSLTTPPCSEGVRWFVLKQPAEVSAEQIDKFEKVMKVANNRPVQAINARVVLK